LGLLWAAHRRGVKVMWTVHNLQSHERFHPQLEIWFRKRLIRRIDGIINLSQRGEALLLDRHPQLRAAPRFFLPLGPFPFGYPDWMTREEARALFGIAEEARVLTYIGRIRRYKNVPLLIRTHRALGDPRSLLIIAGEPEWESERDQVLAAAANDRQVHLHL